MQRNFQNSKQKSTGFTVVEVLFSIVVLTIGIVGVIGFASKILKNSQENASRFTASYLAQEGFEIIRNIRDGNWLEGDSWLEGLDNCQSGCTTDYRILGNENPQLDTTRPLNAKLKIDENLGYNYSTGAETRFERKIQINQTGGKLDVLVTITWDGKPHQFRTELYPWK